MYCIFICLQTCVIYYHAVLANLLESKASDKNYFKFKKSFTLIRYMFCYLTETSLRAVQIELVDSVF